MRPTIVRIGARVRVSHLLDDARRREELEGVVARAFVKRFV
jgi:hypothetical protein